MEAQRADAERDDAADRHGEHLEDQDHGGGGDASGEAEAPAREHLLQGRQHPGLLQHDGGHNAPAAVEGAWWAKEVKGLVVVGKERYVIL